jgi:hypothetical protein
MLAQSGAAPNCVPAASSPGAEQSSNLEPIRVVVSYPYLDAPLIPLLGPGSLMGFAVPTTLSAAAQVNLTIAQGVEGG